MVNIIFFLYRHAGIAINFLAAPLMCDFLKSMRYTSVDVLLALIES